MDYEEKAAKELRNAEFRALQAQINPHFLYNTLDMINWLSQSGQSEKVTEAYPGSYPFLPSDPLGAGSDQHST